jgi:hypothetical protein
MTFAGRYKELEIIVLCEIRQSLKDSYHMYSLICRIWEWRMGKKVKG